MQAVFLTRKFPPSTGGMETFSYQLTQHFLLNKTVIAVGQRQWHIIWAAPVLALRALYAARHSDVVFHWGDALLAPTAAVIQLLTHRPCVVTVHGLEITYTGFGGAVRWLVLWGLRHVRHVVAVSDYTARLVTQSGVPTDRVSVIPHGIVPTKPPNSHEARSIVWSQFISAVDDGNTPLIVSVGRLVPRKGVAWFVGHVLPQLQDLPWMYLVASEGPDRERIALLVQQLGLSERVRLIGELDASLLAQLYTSADVFVMPNITIPGDVEGFGFVAIEAAAHGAVVVSSNTEGIPSAIHKDKNGVLCAVDNTTEYATTLRYWLTHPSERRAFGNNARTYTLQHFRWQDISQQYAKLFKLLSQSHKQHPPAQQ